MRCLCRSYRLRISRVREPASANSVQLASFDMYTRPDAPTEPPADIAEAVKGLWAEVHGPEGPAGEPVQALLLVLANVVQHPREPKFRTLRVANAKIKAMLSAGPAMEQVLKAAGQTQKWRL